MRGPLLHIGYHKTGTNWLQRHLFSRRDRGFAALEHRSRRIYAPNALDFDAAAFQGHYAPQLAAARAAEAIPVLSSERLSGNPHSGGYDSKELADRLAAIFPDARVLIVVREQRAMILSSWRQYVKVGGACGLSDYLLGQPDFRCPRFALEHFCYDRLVRCYQEHFGAPNVKVELYERFRSEPREFAASILEFCGASPAELLAELPFERVENRGRPGLSLALRRRLNPFIRRDSVNGFSPLCNPLFATLGRGLLGIAELLSPPPLDRRLLSHWRHRIDRELGSHYAASNRRLAERIGADLARHGYVVG